MATTIVFSSSSGCTATIEHTTLPHYMGSFTLSAAKQLSVTFYDEGTGNFNFDVGYVAISGDGAILTERKRLSFGQTSGGTWGYGNNASFTADLSSFTFPIELYFTCGGCDNELTGGSTPIQWQSSDGWLIVTDGGSSGGGSGGGSGSTSGSSSYISASISGDVSATTLRVKVSWSTSGHLQSSDVSCIASCNGSSMGVSNGSYVGFTGLTPGSTYNVSVRLSGSSTYTSTETVTDPITGAITTKPVQKTVSDTYTNSLSLTTKKTTISITNSNITSKIIRFRSRSNFSADTMQHKISSVNSWTSVAQMTYTLFNNLDHNSQYTIYARIAGCYAFNTSGNSTGVNDSEVSKVVTTKLLSLAGSISEEHQHSIITLWQAYVDGSARNGDAIDGTLFRFTYMDTLAYKDNPPHQASEVIEGSNGSTTGDYQTDKKIYSNNLTWYYCKYIITASLTDGHNIVSDAVTGYTIFPAAWIYTGGEWHRYMGHVYTNGEYIPAPLFIHRNGEYNEPNGE